MGKSIREQYKLIAGGMVVLIVYGFFMSVVYPQIQKARGVTDFFENLPSYLQIFFGGRGTNISSFEGWVSLEFLHIGWIAIASAIAILLVVGLLAQEIDKGTIELLLSLPFSPSSVFITKISVATIGFIAITAATLASIYAAGAIAGVSFSYIAFLRVTFVGLLLILAIAAMTSLISVLPATR